LPGEVEELTLNAGSHNISVNWKKENVSSYCVSKYVIEWKNDANGNYDSRMVSIEEDSFVIEKLDACVEYELLVRTANERNESSVPITGKMTTQTVGNY
jgi:hypothetical protein